MVGARPASINSLKSRDQIFYLTAHPPLCPMSCLKSVCTLLPPLTSGDRGIKQTLKLTLQLYFTVVIIVQLGLYQSITLNLAKISTAHNQKL